MHSKNLGAFLTETECINALLPQAARLIELRHALSNALPEALGKNYSVANYRQDKLVLYASNAAIAAKLKLLRPALLARLSSLGFEVTAMDIAVQPDTGGAAVQPKMAVLSDRAREAMAELASQLPESELKSVVASIARKK